MNRHHVLLSALMLAVAAFGGCTSIIGGHAVPASGAASAATQADAEPAGGCGRSAEPTTCVEWTETAFDTGDKLLATAQNDPQTAARMLCSALPDSRWETYLGKDFYRYLEDGTTCTVSSQDNQLLIRVAVIPGRSWAQYLAAAGERAKDTTSFRVAGVGVMRSAPTTTTDGIGQDGEDLTIAPTEDIAKPGVLRVQVLLQQPRGKPDTTPVDRTRLDVRDALVTDLHTSLFP